MNKFFKYLKMDYIDILLVIAIALFMQTSNIFLAIIYVYLTTVIFKAIMKIYKTDVFLISSLAIIVYYTGSHFI